MSRGQKRRTVEITLPNISGETMESAVANIFQRKYIRYKEGVIRYSVSIHTFQDMAKDAGAVIKCKGVTLVDTSILEEYLDGLRE